MYQGGSRRGRRPARMRPPRSWSGQDASAEVAVRPGCVRRGRRPARMRPPRSPSGQDASAEVAVRPGCVRADGRRLRPGCVSGAPNGRRTGPRGARQSFRPASAIVTLLPSGDPAERDAPAVVDGHVFVRAPSGGVRADASWAALLWGADPRWLRAWSATLAPRRWMSCPPPGTPRVVPTSGP